MQRKTNQMLLGTIQSIPTILRFSKKLTEVTKQLDGHLYRYIVHFVESL